MVMEGGDIGIGGGGGGRFFFRLLHLVISTGTCFSFLPALRQLSARRRHFEVFIGVFQLLSAVMYSGCDALAMRSAFFVQRDDWHRVSDITTEAYVGLLCIHLYGLRSEETMIWLRYVAFGGAWLAKLGDGWGSVLLEAMLLLAFLLPALAMAAQELVTGRLAPVFGLSASSGGGGGGVAASALAFLDRSLAYDRKIAPLAGGSVAAGAVLLAAELTFDTPLRLLNAVAHCAFGAAAYYLWKLLPCYDKTDELPTFR
jgi:hypothetical protein